MSGVNGEREELAADLERARADFHHLLAATGAEEWGAPTNGTRWTNEELLFHMVFGYMIVQRLLPLMWLFGRLPAGIGTAHARALNAATRPFDVINFYGSRAAARVYNRRRMGRKMDRVVASLQRSLERKSDAELARGMAYPSRWDPYFRNYMTFADLYRYPGRHYDHHRKQLTISGIREA
ncbi:DinB family protein [Nocardia sp. ET3-3]|uniref:DinB family protein n=1 Tax=Nocardia terrae TaxID=2675851 RepID=A0A7K1V2N2_9NOCA|nr:DinB family protein [Nocardia terrae]MVU80900.1 DinB family protein [Nocardia terrae]